MTIFEALKEVFMPREQVLEKREQLTRETEQKLQGHLRKLEQAAIRNVQDSTDEAAEFPHVRRH